MHVDADADLHDVFRILYDGDEWASDNDDEDAGDEQQLGEGVQTATSTEGSMHSRRYSKVRHRKAELGVASFAVMVWPM